MQKVCGERGKLIFLLDKIRIVCCFVFLLLEALADRKKQKVYLIPAGVFFFIGIVLSILQGKEDFIYSVIGAASGGLVILFSFFTKEQIGYGDGFVLLTTGALLGFRVNLYMFLFGLFFASLKGIWLLMTKKANRKTKMAFVPFLLPGLMLSVMLTMSA